MPPKAVFSSSTDTSSDTPRHYPRGHSPHHRHRQLLKWALGPQFSFPKISKWAPKPMYLFELPASGRKQSLKMKGTHIENNISFCLVHCSLGKKEIHQNTCFEQHAFLVASLGFFLSFVFSRFHVFRHQKGGKHNEKVPIWSAHLSN